MAKRLSVRVSDVLGVQIEKYAEEFGVTQSQFSGMCIQAGLGAILRAVKPEDSIPVGTWAAIVQEIEKIKEIDKAK
jgi:hypothetical protein